MLIDILTVLVFGVLGYFAGASGKPSPSNTLNIVLVVLIVVAANIQGAYIGIDQVKLMISAIFEGIFGGVLIRRLASPAVLQPR
jgi:hypothetical protein